MEVIQETGSVAMPRSNPMEVGDAVQYIIALRRGDLRGNDDTLARIQMLEEWVEAIVKQIARDDPRLALRILNDVSHGWREFGEREGTPPKYPFPRD
jgi:hypothetical protein